jgi:CheY-like chemotaxis protein/two-component sensor histidine kinase
MQLALIEELLDVTRIAADRVALEMAPVDVAKLVRGVVDTMAPLATEREVALEARVPDTSVVVSGDRKRLEQITTNLVTNALKFTPSGGRVVVEVTSGDAARLVVTDDGCGIAPEHLPTVFECFRQASGPKRAGLGLGLYIVKQLVELHGGHVTASSEGTGRGATFVVDLPLHGAGGRVPADASQPALPIDADLRGRRILVVEDEPDTRDLLSVLLRRRGAHVAVASDVASALALVGTCVPDVLVSDIELPDGDGCELAERLRRSDVRSIALSGLASERDAQRSLQAGFDVHMTKPVDVGALVATIQRLAND